MLGSEGPKNRLRLQNRTINGDSGRLRLRITADNADSEFAGKLSVHIALFSIIDNYEPASKTK